MLGWLIELNYDGYAVMDKQTAGCSTNITSTEPLNENIRISFVICCMHLSEASLLISFVCWFRLLDAKCILVLFLHFVSMFFQYSKQYYKFQLLRVNTHAVQVSISICASYELWLEIEGWRSTSVDTEKTDK